MKKKSKAYIVITLVLFIVILLSACFKKYEIAEQNIILDESSITESINNTYETELYNSYKRKDGERFQTSIMLEGEEEIVNYEHFINENIGFEMDYDYDSFTRISKSDKEIILPNYEDLENATNYLELTYDSNNIDTVVSSINEELSKTYDTTIDYQSSENLGDYIHIDVSLVKDEQLLPILQESYIIPLNNGCLIATAHYDREAAEGIGRRFANMIDTIYISKH